MWLFYRTDDPFTECFNHQLFECPTHKIDMGQSMDYLFGLTVVFYQIKITLLKANSSLRSDLVAKW